MQVIKRINSRITVVFEGHTSKAERGQTLVKIKGFISLGGSRPFDESDYKTISSAIFASDSDSEKPLELVDQVIVSNNPIADAETWISNELFKISHEDWQE